MLFSEVCKTRQESTFLWGKNLGDKSFKPNLKYENRHDGKDPCSFRSLQNMWGDHFSTSEKLIWMTNVSKPNLKSENSHERREVPSSFRSLQNTTGDHFSTRESCLIGTACLSHSCLQTAGTPSETGSTHRESKKDGKNNNNKPCCSHVTQTHLSLWLTDRPCGLHHQSRTSH